MVKQISNTSLYLECDMDAPVFNQDGLGDCAVFSAHSPGSDGPNEDAAALVRVTKDRCLLVVADGFGGHPAGGRAAATAVQQIEQVVSDAAPSDDSLLSSIVSGFEKANETVREWGLGSATTLSVVEVYGSHVRPYHVGDSAVLVVGQRGRIKFRSVPHSPVGYAVESGLMDEKEAMNHEERHLVSNMVGSESMRIEIGPILKLAPRDTVLLGSDGLWDNLMFDEVVHHIRKGPLQGGVHTLVDLSRERMVSPQEGQPSKPDDLTIIAFRRRSTGR
jgi:serine/threonine protein phosphatase PrpC